MKFLEFYDSTFRSVTLVTGCSILVSSNQLFGDPIQCDLVKEFFSVKLKYYQKIVKIFLAIISRKKTNYIIKINFNHNLYFFSQTGDEVSEKVLKSYCWMYSTFNIPKEFTGQCARKSQSDNPVYNSYYQWVSLFLIFQAFLFYCPRIIWLMSEGGKCLFS